jgi:hypothetical protein
MTRAYLVSALAGAALLGFSTGAIAAVAGEFGNYCATAAGLFRIRRQACRGVH